MRTSPSSKQRRSGFTLVEVLVTTVVVGVMAAVVVPAMIKLAPAGDPARIASDLGSVKMAIDVFSRDLRPLVPGDIEDLVNKITTNDKSLDGVAYREADVEKWKGPYLQWTVDATNTDAGTVKIFKSAGGVQIHSALYRCGTGSLNWRDNGVVDADADEGCEAPGALVEIRQGTDAFLGIKVTGIPASAGPEFKALNDVIDGAGEADPALNGLLRQNPSGTVFYLAAPYADP